MGDIVKQILAKPIQLADQVTKAADEASFFKQECADLKSKTDKLASLLRQAARASSELYERPTRRIIDETEHVLDKALALVLKCRGNGLMKRVFTLNPGAAFRKVSAHLENSIGDVSWLLRVSAGDDGGGLPPIAANEPILCFIWEQIALLHTGSADDRSGAASSLVSLANNSDRYGKLIIEEGGVGPLLKLLKEGKAEGQEHAARAIGLLGRDQESVEHMIHVGACSVFAKILKEGPMKVQAVVGWVVSELASHYPKCQDLFAQHHIIRLLVGHLAFETVEEHSKYTIVSTKPTSIHALVIASSKDIHNHNHTHTHDNDNQTRIPHPLGERPRNLHRVITSTIAIHAANKQGNESNPNQNQNQNHHTTGNGVSNDAKQGNQMLNHQRNYSNTGINMKGRDLEDSKTKAYMKEMAARALWHLAKGNSPICRSITESRALLCFAVLLEKGTEAVQYNSAMAVMEITAVAEKDAELRKSAFKPNSPACKAVVDQVVMIIEKADSELLIPCIKTIGNLARTFKATETRMIGPLVRLLDEREAEVTSEASIALTKFACTENYLHVDHSKAIISAGGAKHLIQLVYFGEEMVKIPALVLLSYIAMHVPDSEELAQAEVLGVIEWASKNSSISNDQTIEALLLESKSRLELYQSRGLRGFHKLHLHQ